MDITRLPFEEQVSPQPWIALRRQRSLDELIQQALEQAPGANSNEVARIVKDWGHDVSGVLIARRMQAGFANPAAVPPTAQSQGAM